MYPQNRSKELYVVLLCFPKVAQLKEELAKAADQSSAERLAEAEALAERNKQLEEQVDQLFGVLRT